MRGDYEARRKRFIAGRLDERTSNIWRTIEKNEKHQETQNGILLTTYTLAETNKTKIRNIQWVGSGVVSIITGVWLWYINRGGS